MLQGHSIKPTKNAIAVGIGFGVARISIPFAAPGDFPVVNTLQAQGAFGFSFNQAQTRQQLAILLVNNNTVSAFDITFHFTNLGNFKSGTREIALSNIQLHGISGTLGADLTPPVNTAVTLDGSGDWTWDPGATQSTETVNYLVELVADWPDASNQLAGFYSEGITATISIGL
jgi:hypothetical protein